MALKKEKNVKNEKTTRQNPTSGNGNVKLHKKLKETENKYRTLYQSSQDAIMTLTPEGQFTAGNPATVKIFKCVDEAGFISNTPPDLSPKKQPDGRKSTEKAMEMINTAIKKGSHYFEWTHKRTNGENFPATVLLTRLEIEGKTMLQATVRDITEQKKYEQALEDSKILIEQEVSRQTKKISELNQELKKYAKKLDLKVKRIDEKRIPLTNKEKLAFWGFVRYPKMNSTALAKQINLPATTVNSIKNRLKKEGYFQTMYIPRLDLLGANIFSVDYSTQKIHEESSGKMGELKDSLTKKFGPTPELVFLEYSEKLAMTLRISKNWEAVMELEAKLDEALRGKNIYQKIFKMVHFPVEKSHLSKFFDFSSLIKSRFGLDVSETPSKQISLKKHYPSKSEKILIHGLTVYPNHGVAELSKAIGISVPTICKLKKKLLNNGLINIVNFPDFKKIGMELLVINHHQLTKTAKYFEGAVQCHIPNVFFTINNKSDLVSFSLHKNYSDIESSAKLCTECNDSRLENNPNRTIIPLDKINFTKIDFSPITKKIFEIDDELRQRSLKKRKAIRNPIPRLHIYE